MIANYFNDPKYWKDRLREIDERFKTQRPSPISAHVYEAKRDMIRTLYVQAKRRTEQPKEVREYG